MTENRTRQRWREEVSHQNVANSGSSALFLCRALLNSDAEALS
jgi:hypothetical protein